MTRFLMFYLVSAHLFYPFIYVRFCYFLMSLSFCVSNNSLEFLSDHSGLSPSRIPSKVPHLWTFPLHSVEFPVTTSCLPSPKLLIC